MLFRSRLCEEAGETESVLCTEILRVAPSTCKSPRSAPIIEDVSLDELREAPGNNYCADCGSSDNSWASTNLGVFLCIRCSGVHRSLGVHISMVLSCTLDIWTQPLVLAMEQKGNQIVNQLYEHHIIRSASPYAVKLQPDATMIERQVFIKAKYINKTFHQNSFDSSMESYRFRRSKLVNLRIQSSSQTNLRPPSHDAIPSMPSIGEKAMIQYCGIVFIAGIALKRMDADDPSLLGSLRRGGPPLVSALTIFKKSMSLSFILGSQVVYWKSSTNKNASMLKLNMPMDEHHLVVRLHRRSRLNKDSVLVSQQLFDLKSDQFQNGTALLELPFPETFVRLSLSVTLESLQ